MSPETLLYMEHVQPLMMGKQYLFPFTLLFISAQAMVFLGIFENKERAVI